MTDLLHNLTTERASILNDPGLESPGHLYFLVSRTWFNSWRSYADEAQDFQGNENEILDFISSKHPGPISNFELVKLSPEYKQKFQERQFQENLVSAKSDFADWTMMDLCEDISYDQFTLLSPKNWQCLLENYGGGPEIPIFADNRRGDSSADTDRSSLAQDFGEKQLDLKPLAINIVRFDDGFPIDSQSHLLSVRITVETFEKYLAATLGVEQDHLQLSVPERDFLDHVDWLDASKMPFRVQTLKELGISGEKSTILIKEEISRSYDGFRDDLLQNSRMDLFDTDSLQLSDNNISNLQSGVSALDQAFIHQNSPRQSNHSRGNGPIDFDTNSDVSGTAATADSNGTRSTATACGSLDASFTEELEHRIANNEEHVLNFNHHGSPGGHSNESNHYHPHPSHHHHYHSHYNHIHSSSPETSMKRISALRDQARVSFHAPRIKLDFKSPGAIHKNIEKLYSDFLLQRKQSRSSSSLTH